MTYDFNVEPYFDDYDENKEFYRVLFRPQYAVQARELNQIQSILQNQVDSVGKHLFKDGSVVVPGKISYDNQVQYVKVQNLNINSDNVESILSNLPFKILIGQTSGVKAVVVHHEPAAGAEPHMLFIEYISSGTTSSVFEDGEELVDADNQYSILAAAADATGTGTMAYLTNGIYYINNNFVKVFNSTLVLSRYDASPSCKVGIEWVESIVTPEDDESLLDNAYGTQNYSAPGAHRYKIATNLVKIGLTDTLDNFVELLEVTNGDAVLKQIYPKYNEIEKELARRTYKESGDYVVDEFDLQMNEYRNNNMGAWTSNTVYYRGDIVTYEIGGNTYYFECIADGTSSTTAPTFAIDFSIINESGGSTVKWLYTERFSLNDGLVIGADPTKYVITNKNGSAFVKGFEYNTTNIIRLINDKPRDYARQNSGTITVYDGTYILVSNVYGYLTDLGIDFVQVNLYDRYTATPGTASGSQVGTAKVRWMERDSGSSNYKLYVYDVEMTGTNTFEDNCKQIYVSGFTADLVPQLTQLTGSITAAGTAVTGTGTLFSTELAAGDYITVDSTGGLTNMRRVSSTSSNVAMTLDSSLTTTGTVFYIAKATLYNTTYNSAIFKMPHSMIRKLKSADDITSDTRYTFTKDFGTFTATATTYAITVSSGVETFASVNNSTNYLLFNTTDNNIHTTATYSVDVTSTTLTIGNLTIGKTYKLLGTVDKTATQRSKTLNISSIDFTSEADIATGILSLGKADCYKILSIKQAPAYGTINGSNEATLDVTELFELDSGQTSLYYGLGSIKRINKQVKITGSIRVYFEYFTHSTGDYFTVESYANAIPYTSIEPKLRDTIDFRPVRNDTDTGFDQATVGILKSGNNVSADYSYYLARIDAMVLSKDKTITLIKGESAIKPKRPIIPQDSIALYYFYNFPYGSLPSKTVVPVKVDNRGYTMGDIASLEDRIAKLEDYVSFNLLEKSTAELSIKDSNGFDMFKNGFIVETFSDHGIGQTDDADYRCFINSSTNELYPPQYEEGINLVEKNTSSLRSGYVVKGEAICLDYEEVEYTSNLQASRPININPFSIVSFNGITVMTPASDTWMDTNTLPTIYRNR